jgi:hypothetical protein
MEIRERFAEWRTILIGTDDRAFEEAPYVLYGVGMNISTDIFVQPVIDRLMAVLWSPIPL